MEWRGMISSRRSERHTSHVLRSTITASTVMHTAYITIRQFAILELDEEDDNAAKLKPDHDGGQAQA